MSKMELAARYVQQSLDESVQQEYEEHFAVCDACQDELETVLAARDALAHFPVPVPRPNAVHSWFRRYWSIPAVAAAAVIMTVLLWRPLTRDAAPPAASAAPDPARRAIMELARVEAPPYSPMRLRGSNKQRDRQFRTAMNHYSRRDYAAAAVALDRLLGQQGSEPRTLFYLGVSRLLSGDASGSLDPLSAAAASNSPYAGAASFYSAKARLRLGELDAARTALDQAIRMGGQDAQRARALLADIDRFTGR